MKAPEIIIDGEAPKVIAEIHWQGMVMFPEMANGVVQTYTTRTDAERGARRALRRLGWVDLWTDADKRRKKIPYPHATPTPEQETNP